MARIKDSSVEAVKAAADFVDVVSARTQLRKSGGRYSGRCPFHDERTPSFSVNAVDKLYYCFGCGAKGDLITFVRETEGLDFAGAIEWLGERFRVPIEYEESSPAQDAARKRRERLVALLEQAASFYERTLWDSAGRRHGARLPQRARPERGDLPRVPARPRPRRNLAGAQGAREGLRPRGAARGGTDPAAWRRLLPAAAPVPARRPAGARARLPGAQAARGRSAAGRST